MGARRVQIPNLRRYEWSPRALGFMWTFGFAGLRLCVWRKRLTLDDFSIPSVTRVSFFPSVTRWVEGVAPGERLISRREV